MNTEQLREIMNENTYRKVEAMRVDKVRLEGNKGFFWEGSDEGKKELGKSIEGTIIGVRKSLNSYSTTRKCFTTEYDSKEDEVALFQSTRVVVDRNKKTYSEWTKGGKPLQIGKSSEVREQNAELKVTFLLYTVLTDGSFRKIACKGSGMTNWFDYLKTIDGDLFEKTTIFECESMEGEQGEYFAMTFKRGSVVPMEAILEVAGEFHKNRLEVKESYKKSREISEPIKDIKQEVREAFDVSIDETPAPEDDDFTGF